MRAGFVGYLTKPIKQSELFNIVTGSLIHKQPVKSSNGLTQLSMSTSQPQAKIEVQKPKEADPVLDRQKRILVAEDNVVNQLLAMTALKSLGYSAHAVANGREAVDAVASGHYD